MRTVFSTKPGNGSLTRRLQPPSTSVGLLVLGSHGRGELAGSTAVAVTTRAHCPVCVVPLAHQQLHG
ncbi:universal stress protein [Lentzea sp. NPDC034063]|uniref:universal stress protein n=1 Tax=Lentzea sp. NPDC034063 TaxID=3154912 RepID=UPI0033E346F0